MADNEILKKLSDIQAMLVEQGILKKDVLTFEEAVIFLSISSSYLYKLTSSGAIKHYKPHGKKIYFKRVELQDWLLAHPVKLHTDTNTEASTFVTLNEPK